jgi:hypothetical protein
MALFNLTDIKFNRETRGKLNDIVSSDYERNILRYPIDIGANYDKGHYMVIYINQQEKTAEEFRREPSKRDLPTIAQSAISIRRQRGVASSSDVVNEFRDNIEKFGETLGASKGSIGDFLGAERPNIFRTINRTTDAIALYMPDTLNFTFNQGYSDPAVIDSLGNLGTVATLLAAGGSIKDAFEQTRSTSGLGPAVAGLLGNLTPFALQAIRQSAGGIAGNIAGLTIAAGGRASNPGLEILYSSPSFRSFRFEFMFYPRSQKEANEVMNIIDKLKFHQAPEISSFGGGKFLIPPSEFDIEFFYNGYENPNIPKISTCVLEVIDVDYAPNGFSAYEVPKQETATKGGTGTPTAIRLSLQFKETQIITKEFLRGESYEIGGTSTTAQSSAVQPQSNIVGKPLGSPN